MLSSFRGQYLICNVHCVFAAKSSHSWPELNSRTYEDWDDVSDKTLSSTHRIRFIIIQAVVPLEHEPASRPARRVVRTQRGRSP